MSNPDLVRRFDELNHQIRHFEQQFQRPPHSVTLLAVSKGHSPQSIQALHQLGQKDFGENYVQEALEKISALSQFPINWHFIGTVQTNKAKLIAKHFHWIHTIRRTKDIITLAKYRSETQLPLQLCIQLKIDSSNSKEGASVSQLEDLFSCCLNYPQKVQLRGLMGFPAQASEFAMQCQQFEPIAQAFIHYQNSFAIDTLCIGTSHDFGAAIKMGATMCRIGTQLFGQRKRKTSE